MLSLPDSSQLLITCTFIISVLQESVRGRSADVRRQRTISFHHLHIDSIDASTLVSLLAKCQCLVVWRCFVVVVIDVGVVVPESGCVGQVCVVLALPDVH